MPDKSQDTVDIRTMVLLAFSATAGVLVEYYDFFIFGYAAASAFPKMFFPTLSPTAALVFSYLTFGAGFPARLLGAFIFGHFGDRTGRKYSFVINIFIVGATTCLVGLLPGYATLGIAAPALLLSCCASFKGSGSAASLAALPRCWLNSARSESIAPSGCRWPTSAFPSAPWRPAPCSCCASSFTTTGWRVAMLLSAVIVVPALLARYKLADTPLFERLKQREQLAKMPSFGVLRKHARPIILLALVSAFQQMDGYVSGTYIISFMKLAGIPLATTAVIILSARIGDVLGVVLAGPLADLFKRKVVTSLAIVFTAVLSYPYVLAIIERQVVMVMALQFMITFSASACCTGWRRS